jgi:hypothetical protein
LQSRVGGNLPESPFYDVKEAAFILHRSTKSVRRIVYRGLLPKDKNFAHIRIPRKAVEAYVKQSSEFAFTA